MLSYTLQCAAAPARIWQREMEHCCVEQVLSCGSHDDKGRTAFALCSA